MPGRSMALAPGTRLGPYESSTASSVPAAWARSTRPLDTRLDRTVAIKVLPEHVASDPELKQRFEREAKTLAALSHPHICPVFDVGSQNPSTGSGQAVDFLVMECLEGETLEQRLKKGALPLDQALQMGIQIADALAVAHRAGIVHRDLKPGNIMLTKSGAKLLDFGLAKVGASAVAGGLSMLPTTPPDRRSRARFSARSSTWRRSSSKATRRTRGQTSSRSGPSCTKWSRARRRSRVRVRRA